MWNLVGFGAYLALCYAIYKLVTFDKCYHYYTARKLTNGRYIWECKNCGREKDLV